MNAGPEDLWYTRGHWKTHLYFVSIGIYELGTYGGAIAELESVIANVNLG